MKLTIENAKRASKTTAVTTDMATTGLLLLDLKRAARENQEDAAIDAEDILAQAEEANALDPVG
jgi:hypothetical protein